MAQTVPARQTVQNMTEGSPVSLILRFALPIFISQVFQQLYSTADAFIVGKYLGTNAFAAVSSSGTLIMLLTSFFIGTALGAGVALSGVAVFLYQGLITLCASFIAPFLSDVVIAEMKCVGSLLIIGLSFNMLGMTKIKVMNYVPAVFFPILLCTLM